jgi:hypothetical protein
VQGLNDRIRRAEARVQRQQAEYQQQTWDTALSAGVGVLGALLGNGRRRGLGTARAALRSASRSVKERDDVARAEEEVSALREQLAALEADLEAEFRAVHAAAKAGIEPLERVEVRPKKTDIAVGTIALAWIPHLPTGARAM